MASVVNDTCIEAGVQSMDNSLIQKIKESLVSKKNGPAPFPPASKGAIDEAEAWLGFGIPEFLKTIYLEIGNGGFGPGSDGLLIGVSGGYASDLGTIVDVYEAFKKEAKYLGSEWLAGLLPFCEWGCNIYSCVSCNDIRLPVYMSEVSSLRPQSYTLDGFMEMWAAGIDIQTLDVVPTEMVEIVNPFTRKKMYVKVRRVSPTGE
jgi:hypothetical protein